MTAIGSQGVTRMDYQYQTTEQPSSPPRKAWPIRPRRGPWPSSWHAVPACAFTATSSRKHWPHAAIARGIQLGRKAVLDTSENGSELQKLIRGALGVNDIIDAFADAATSARTQSIRKAARRKPPSRSSIS